MKGMYFFMLFPPNPETKFLTYNLPTYFSQENFSKDILPNIFNLFVSYDCWRQLRTVHGHAF